MERLTVTGIDERSGSSSPGELGAVQKTDNNVIDRLLNKLPSPLRRIIFALLKRAGDPDTEDTSTNNQPGGLVLVCGWFPGLTLSCALGILSTSYSFSAGRDGQFGLELFFVLSMLLIFVPITIRLLSPAATRFERITIVCTAGISLYLIKVLTSPAYFSMYDEFLHWRTADDIMQTGHLFTSNALLPVSAYYPGMEIVTNALSTLSGMSTFHTALIVIGVARVLMVLSLFLLNERLTKSPRMAGIATIIYMGNPHFLLFDAQYAYESLALPLTVFVLLVIELHQFTSVRFNGLKSVAPIVMFAKARNTLLRGDLRWLSAVTLMVLITVVFTHHMTDYFLDGILVLWAGVYIFLHLKPLYRSYVARIALVGLILSVIAALQIGNPVVDYITSFFQMALVELKHILTGMSSARPLFQSYTGIPTPIWERILTILSQLLVLLGLPFGLLCLWLRFRKQALVVTFGVLVLCYPLVQVFRFTNAGGELVDRSAAFLYIPISTVLAIMIVQLWPTRWLRWKHLFSLAIALSVIALGGTILGVGPSMSLLPGPYMIAADTRSIDMEGIQDAAWTRTYLGPDNRVATDRTNQILEGTYGHQRIVDSIYDRVDISPIFFSPQMGPDEVGIIRAAKIHFLVVDMRMSKARPLLGFYIDESEVDAYQHTSPVDPHNLTKFNTVSQLNKVFDSGNIVIYDTGGLVNAPEKP
ncbi:hypothetical protein KDH_60630 [Dictyobacter sp. S3.2.2.5]|uniref:Glycosyltransferase RgtA/B/C/D-like domain-containing protein n=1 Tax=Dictyobacter halimunensis TaxID=3026934 RepID=A0ABQ6FY70_9CHLR|nr:hypothetical protein KDH_60630 [Dictyobacter sp. S3.2.2.5]